MKQPRIISPTPNLILPKATIKTEDWLGEEPRRCRREEKHEINDKD